MEAVLAADQYPRFVSSFLRDRVEADDALQEVALVIVERFEDWDSERPFVAWALGTPEYCRKRVIHYRNLLEFSNPTWDPTVTPA
ncbi:MAG: hypothetical protein ACKVHE_36560 [Planctomycetales bacterium]